MNCEALHEEIRRLQGMLSRSTESFICEQNWRIQLSQELSDTKEQLAYHKAKTESFIKQQVESLHSEPETEGNTVEHDPQLIDALKAEIDGLKVEKATLRAEKDTLKAEKDTLQRELDTEKLTHADRTEQDLKLIETLRTEKDSLSQKMAEEMMKMQKEMDSKVMLYEAILAPLRTMLEMQVSLNNQLLAKLNAKKVTSCEEHDDPEEHEDGQCEDQDSLPGALHHELTEDAVVPEQIATGTTKPKSRWKRFRHFLGLRKPQKWKK